ncbi:MAG TPA: site-specific DNA-methyltransferase [Patescibacteria group bacterium]
MSNVFFESLSTKIINEDFLKTDLIGKESVDLVVTSPPYNVDIKYNSHKDNLSYKEYIEFSRKWLNKAFSLMKSGGRLCLNVPLDTDKDGKRSIYADLTVIAKKVGFKYKGTIIWNKQNVKNKYAMVFSKNIEVIIIFYKDEWKPVKKEYMEWVNETWKFSGENATRMGHPAAFPIELPTRLIKMFSEKEDVVLDPFMGSGTTLVAAKKNERKGIGVEIDEKYCELARTRSVSI